MLVAYEVEMRIVAISLMALLLATGAVVAQSSCADLFGCQDKRVSCEDKCKNKECIRYCNREFNACFRSATSFCARPEKGYNDRGMIKTPDGDDRTDPKMVINPDQLDRK
jgi:hypothetical protein